MRNICIIISLLLTACSMAPDKKEVKHAYPVPDKFKQFNSYVTKDKVSPANWWESLGDQKLNTIIMQMITNNLDIKLAINRVKLLESQFDMNRGMRYPTVTAGGSASYGRAPAPTVDSNTGMSYVAPKTSSTFSLRTGLRFELDVWGKLKSTEQAVIAELMATKSDLHTIYLTMIAQTILLYYDIEAQKQLLELAKETVKNYTINLKLQRKRYISGVGKTLNIEQTKQMLAVSKVSLESAKQQLKLKQHQLSILLGEYPENNTREKQTEIGMPDFTPIPAGLPSDLLRTRSDIVSAEFKMEAARYQIGVAKADLFPSLSLTSTLGYINLTELENLFTSDYLTSSIGVSVDQTLFAGGSKIAILDQKKVLYAQSELNYKKVVLNAFKEVEDALVQIDAADKQLKLLQAARNAAKAALTESEKRYLKGLLPYDRFLDAQKSYYTAESNLINGKKALIFARIQLHKVLGGNWVPALN